MKDVMTVLDQKGKSHNEHLVRVRALAEELQMAISALEKNDVKLLEQSLAVQERLCHEIATMKMSPVSSDAKPSIQTPEIRNAYMALAQKKRVYAALLKRSSRTVSLLGGLYRCYGAGLDKKSMNSQTTWSCEV
jgi:hypothetical protein